MIGEGTSILLHDLQRDEGLQHQPELLEVVQRLTQQLGLHSRQYLGRDDRLAILVDACRQGLFDVAHILEVLLLEQTPTLLDEALAHYKHTHQSTICIV